jgi:hypothetical protein
MRLPVLGLLKLILVDSDLLVLVQEVGLIIVFKVLFLPSISFNCSLILCSKVFETYFATGVLFESAIAAFRSRVV